MNIFDEKSKSVRQLVFAVNWFSETFFRCPFVGFFRVYTRHHHFVQTKCCGKPILSSPGPLGTIVWQDLGYTVNLRLENYQQWPKAYCSASKFREASIVRAREIYGRLFLPTTKQLDQITTFCV